MFANHFWSNRGAMRVHGGTYYEHICSAWVHRGDPSHLILFYEDIISDMKGVVKKVAEFMGIDDEECISKAAHNASRERMLAHGSKFDDTPGRKKFNKLAGLNEMAGETKCLQVPAHGHLHLHNRRCRGHYKGQSGWENATAAITRRHQVCKRDALAGGRSTHRPSLIYQSA